MVEQPKDNEPPLKEAWSGHMTHLNFFGLNRISGTAEATVVRFLPALR